MIELVVDIQHCLQVQFHSSAWFYVLKLFSYLPLSYIVITHYFLQAFVGVAQDPNAIIIAFRGTQEHR